MKAYGEALKKNGGKRRARGFALILACLVLLFLSAGCGSGTAADGSLRKRAESHDELISLIREGYRSHASAITLGFKRSEDVGDELPELIAGWIDEAMAETERGDEGDYIRFQNGGYSLATRVEAEGEGYRYSVSIRPKYYTFLSQEEELAGKEAEIAEALGLSDMSGDLEKTKAVYDYLCSHVSYDSVHEGNPYHTIRSTAYGALVRESATCMGYSAAMYRLLKGHGVNCRIVRGKAVNAAGEEKDHAWNAVTVDGELYFFDATWDAGEAQYRYFMKSEEEFASHTAESAF